MKVMHILPLYCLCIHTHTHTHTHVCFCEKWGHPIGVMVFILYKLYVLLPYTYPIPKLSPHRKLGISTFSKKKKKTHSVWFISLLKNGDMGQCPHKSLSPCNTYVIPMSLYKFMSSFVTKTRMHTHTHTHTCWFLWFTGTLHRRNGFYTEQSVCAIALHQPYT